MTFQLRSSKGPSTLNYRFTIEEMDANLLALRNGSWVSVKEYGAVGDGITDDTSAIQSALTSNTCLYFPPGTYITTLLTKTISASHKLIGAGRGVTVIKRKANNVNIDGEIQKMLLIYITNSSSFTISSITFDGNGQNQPAAPEGDDFFQQSSHSISVTADGADVGFINIFDVELLNSTADGISLSARNSGAHSYINLNNIRAINRTHVRSDITITSNFQSLLISNCELDSFEVEHNDIDPLTYKNTLLVNNLLCRLTFDANFKNSSGYGVFPKVVINNLIQGIGSIPPGIGLSRRLNIANSDLYMNNFRCIVDQQIYLRGYHYLENGKIEASENWTSGHTSLLREQSTNGGTNELIVNNVTFDAHDDSIAAGLTEFYINDNVAPTSEEDYIGVTFQNCIFKHSSIKTAYIRNGQFTFRNCTHYFTGTDACIETGNLRGYNKDTLTRHRLENNFVYGDTYLYKTPPTFVPSGTTGNYGQSVFPLELKDTSNWQKDNKIIYVTNNSDLFPLDISVYYGGSADIRDRIKFIDSSPSRTITITSTTYTAGKIPTILVDDTTAGGEVTITIPHLKNTIYKIKKIGNTANVVIQAETGNIEFSNNISLTIQGESVTLISNGTDIFVI